MARPGVRFPEPTTAEDGQPRWVSLVLRVRHGLGALVDAEDVRIFCELAFQDLGSQAFARKALSPAGIGKKLGLDEKTVRLRVKRMEEAGFIKYWKSVV